MKNNKVVESLVLGFLLCAIAYMIIDLIAAEKAQARDIGMLILFVITCVVQIVWIQLTRGRRNKLKPMNSELFIKKLQIWIVCSIATIETVVMIMVLVRHSHFADAFAAIAGIGITLAFIGLVVMNYAYKWAVTKEDQQRSEKVISSTAQVDKLKIVDK
jgi:hypothetical protein